MAAVGVQEKNAQRQSRPVRLFFYVLSATPPTKLTELSDMHVQLVKTLPVADGACSELGLSATGRQRPPLQIVWEELKIFRTSRWSTTKSVLTPHRAGTEISDLDAIAQGRLASAARGDPLPTGKCMRGIARRPPRTCHNVVPVLFRTFDASHQPLVCQDSCYCTS